MQSYTATIRTGHNVYTYREYQVRVKGFDIINAAAAAQRVADEIQTGDQVINLKLNG